MGKVIFRAALVAFGFFCLCVAVGYSQTVPKSYHPVDPKVDGGFINYGRLNVGVEQGSTSQNGERLVISGNSVVKVERSKFWDVVHLPKGTHGGYCIHYYSAGSESELCLGKFSTTTTGVFVDHLGYGAEAVTSKYWGPGAHISYYNIGQYMALVAPTVNSDFPDCGQLVVRTYGDTTVELVSVVVAGDGSCAPGPTTCMYRPETVARLSPSTDRLVNSTWQSLPVRAVQYTKYLNGLPRTDEIRYESYYIAAQLSLAIAPLNLAALLNTSVLIYGLPIEYLPFSNYTVGEVLTGYRTATLTSEKQKYSLLLRALVEARSNDACNQRVR